MTEINTSPLVLHGRRRSVARLRAGVLLLETDGVRHRIPVAAIGRVYVNGPRGRVLTITLAAARADPADPARRTPVTYSLTSRNAPAAAAFAEAVRRALPVRYADEPRPEAEAEAGVEVSVSVEPIVRSRPDLGRVIVGTLCLAFVLVAVVLVARGAGERAVVCWLGGPVLLGAGVAGLMGGGRAVREAVVLRGRGITVEGRLTRSYEVGTGEDAVTHHTYEYVDALGTTRTRSGPEGGAGMVEILYDPEDPEGVTKVGHGTAGHLAFGLVFLALGLPTALAGLWMSGVGVTALFR
ncbi:hypothetical protein [Streptomyces sp. NPDC088196]|uniref:hypothetical protein n=1 Tax=Streptomyces sp. NPDC088196 TaxID=3154868 RepID=UPI00344C3DB3